MLEIIQQAIKPHDKYQIEIKLDYELVEDQDTHYRISTYIFIPQSLGINRDTYQKHYFYRDAQSYIRLKTPVISLGDLSEGPHMPLATIGRLIQTENWTQNTDVNEQVIHNCKLLSAMLKSTLREHINLIYKWIGEVDSELQIELMVSNLVEEFLTRNAQIGAGFRAYFPAFNLPQVNREVFSAFTLMDESISLMIEESGIEMFQIVSTYFSDPKKTEFLQRLTNQIEREADYRSARGFAVLKVGEENEKFVFRTSVLSKYAASVLYLSTAVSREGRGREQMIFAAAAGIAMIFATIVAFYFQRSYGNFTFPVFAALVVGYMFKDRIKEFARDLFATRLLGGLPDRRIDIKTLDGNHKLGILREKVVFVREKDVPRLVMQARNKDMFNDLDNDGQGEDIICYTKDIVLHASAFNNAFAGQPKVTGLNDILRYDIRAYLNKMADPYQRRLSLIDGRLQTITCHKVYNLNFITRYRAIQPTKEKYHTRTRLVLTRKGIKRIEEIST